jgi:hypothetical protein
MPNSPAPSRRFRFGLRTLFEAVAIESISFD